MIENSVIFISAYIIASVCNNIFFVLFIFSHKMKLLPFSESIIFLTFSSTDFRTQFVWMGVFFFNFFVTGWEFKLDEKKSDFFESSFSFCFVFSNQQFVGFVFLIYKKAIFLSLHSKFSNLGSDLRRHPNHSHFFDFFFNDLRRHPKD